MFLMYKCNQIRFIPHMHNNTKFYPPQLDIALQNWTKQYYTPQQMNQTLTEHHIAQYNILLIEDQTVNQTKHA